MDPRVKMVLTFLTFSRCLSRATGWGFAGGRFSCLCGTAFKAAGKAGAQKHKAGYPAGADYLGFEYILCFEGTAVFEWWVIHITTKRADNRLLYRNQDYLPYGGRSR